MASRHTALAVALVLLFVAAAVAVWFWVGRSGDVVDRPAPSAVASDGSPAAIPDATLQSGSSADSSTAEMPEDLIGDGIDEPDFDPVRILGTVQVAGRSETPSGYLKFRHELGRRAYARIAVDGTYETILPFAGEWTVSALLETYRKYEEELPIPEGETERRHDILLDPLRVITVYIRTPDGAHYGAALAERGIGSRASVLATEEPPGPVLPPAEDRSRPLGIGRFKAGRNTELHDPVGRLELETDGPIWVSAILRQTVLATQRVPDGVDEIELVVSADDFASKLGSIRVRLVDALTLTPLSEGYVSRDRRPSVNVDGTYVWKHMSPGVTVLNAGAEGYGFETRHVRLEPGQDLDLGDWPLSPVAAIAGEFVDPWGRPAWIEYAVHDLDRSRPGFPLEGGTGHSIPNGAFTVPGLGAGRFAIVPTSQEWAWDPVEVDTRYGPVLDLRVTLRRGTPVSLESELPSLEAAVVHLFDASGLPVVSRYIHGSDGAIDVILAPGTYSLTLVDDAGKGAKSTVTVTAAPLAVPVGRDE